MFTDQSSQIYSDHRGMYNSRPLCHNERKVRILKAECRKEKERGRLDRRVWRPVEHIFFPLPLCVARRHSQEGCVPQISLFQS